MSKSLRALSEIVEYEIATAKPNDLASLIERDRAGKWETPAFDHFLQMFTLQPEAVTSGTANRSLTFRVLLAGEARNLVKRRTEGARLTFTGESTPKPDIPKQSPEEGARTLVAELKQDLASASRQRPSKTLVHCLGLLRTKEAMDELKAIAESDSQLKATAKEVLEWLDDRDSN